jgi:hypothetical protein
VVNEPVAQWGNILTEIISQRVPRATIERYSTEGREMARRIGGITHVISFGLDNKRLDVEGWLTTPRLLDAAARHAVFAVSEILRPMIDFVDELASQASRINLRANPNVCQVPDLREFFWFLPRERPQILAKKRWP